ncbi:MAG: hypothetical protein GW809_01075 [Bacteroidetes bacterium]|nr:hypothetical protein [Bacteroidota bacterium]NCQ10754.1 hypothetical protein [Bacteroidota bacterium]
MKINYLLLLLLLFLLINSCTNYTGNPTLFTNELKQLNYGTSFGMCVGFCQTLYEITDHQIRLTKSTWSWQDVPSKSCTTDLSESDFIAISSILSISEIKKLPPIIGCPDCADGGAEYIELIFLDGLKQRVTFEYMHEPNQLSELVELLRQKTADFKECSN